jgi:acetate kinase
MRVLALNPGSSSLRFRLLASDAEPGQCLAAGKVSDLGPNARARAGLGAGREEVPGVRAEDHAAALDWALGWIAERIERGALEPVQAIGVRSVLCDPLGRAAALLDDALERELALACDRAPLHGPAELALLRAARVWARGALPVVAVYDSAFHARMSEAAATYALPDGWARRHGVRRFGFHGLAIASALEEHARRTGSRGERRRIVLHLGGGASVSAVLGLRCLDTSMGFSPLEGLAMSTRSGDVDPALVPWLAGAEGLAAGDVVRALNERAGLLGLSGTSGDMREIERLRAAGDTRARLAFDVFVHRARRWLGAMAAVLGGVDEVLFSGGIGERSSAVREAVCRDMAWCGLVLDPARNARPSERDGRIGADGARVAAHVVPVDEERLIARATGALLEG